jgi:hypothetical protein
VVSRRARRGGPEPDRSGLLRWRPILFVEHAAFVLLLASGAALMLAHGWRWGYPQWLTAKAGLVLSLFVPLELLHAWAVHVWMRRTLTGPLTPMRARLLERGLSMQGMVWALAVPLLGLAVPLVVWWSLRRPF